MEILTEFKKALGTALKERRINEQRKIEIETEYCYIQIYTPNELPKFIKKVMKEIQS